MKQLDLPPVWLLVFVVAALLGDRLLSVDLFGRLGDVLGLAFAGGGLALMAAAVRRIRAAGTPLVPNRIPTALVTEGVFRHTRNPIYLGMAMVLLGLLFWIDAPLLLPLVPGFLWLLTRRFVEPEEARLRLAFGQAFEDWASRTRRWI